MYTAAKLCSSETTSFKQLSASPF